MTNAIIKSFSEAVLAAALISSLVLGLFLISESNIGRAATDEFTVTQVITDALSFAQIAGDVTMVGQLDALTGGTSYGTTTVRVRTNNVSGYNMTIKFEDAVAMNRNGSADTIPNFVYSTSTASFPAGFDTSPANAQFAFSANASNTAEVASVFTNSGALCGTANNGSFAVNNCWRGASTTLATVETPLILTTGPTLTSGSTSSVQFRITIPTNPSPAVPNGTYVATATLTAIEN